MKVKTPAENDLVAAIEYLRRNGLGEIVEAADVNWTYDTNEKLETADTFNPDLLDLYRLHQLVVLNKRTTVIEFGTGWSSWVIADALCKVKTAFAKDVKDLRRNNPFELHVVDDESKYIDIAKARIPANIKESVVWHQKSVGMGTFNDRICTFYESLPLVSPDLIYVDGPNQFNVHGDVAGWSTRHRDMMPMVGDILRIEHFLTPGTIVIFDGRAANARFFCSNTQRNWAYQFDPVCDQHIYLLDEEPLGSYNRKQINFYGA